MPTLRCYPYVIRLRQCITAGQRANAVKYTIAVLPILLMAWLKHVTPGQLTDDTGIKNYHLTAGQPLGDLNPYLMKWW